VLQHLSVVFESANPTVVRRFWQRVRRFRNGHSTAMLSATVRPERGAAILAAIR
jgi:hypothetical protein